MKGLRKMFCAVTLAGAMLLSGGTGFEAGAADRGNSGLPPGPGNPIAALYSQIKDLIARVTNLENAGSQTATMWINHLDLVPGGDEVQTFFDSTNSGVGGGLSGLIVMSTTAGDTFTGGGNKVIEKGLQVPPNYKITGVRICYESSSATSFITQIRLGQLQDPPSTALVMLDDGTDLTNTGPVCVNSAATSVDPSLGAVRLSLRVNFDATTFATDKIVIRGLGLLLERTGL
jgi:hypothetical protein